MQPAYGPRGQGSVSAMISMARIFGAPLTVPAGKVAVSVAVDEEHAVGGAIAPNDQVDVYVSNNGVADRLCSASVIDTSAHGQESESSSITWATLAIDPERVSEVLAATAKGAVSLTMPEAASGENASDGDADEDGEKDAGEQTTSDSSGNEDGEEAA